MNIEEVQDGDIFILGDHRLACGNCQDERLLSRLIAKVKISVVLTDPPYGVEYTESKNGFKQNLSCAIPIANDDITSDDQYKEFSATWLTVLKKYLAEKNSIYIFNSDKMIFALKKSLDETGFKLSQLLIWVKSQAVVGRLDYLPQHELIAYGWYGRHQFRKAKDKSVLFFPKPSKSKLHATMKPVALLRNLILNSTKLGEVVFDGFGGSGSTLISCEQLKRKCIIVETEKQHCLTIIKRWEKLTGEVAKKYEFA
ncbi:MAG: ParB family nuclease domain and DNA-modification methylase domain protein [Parcubacteria group bacterium GW2011_GWE2_39_37]|uniref:ParB family nuclease domain and DNA-modification methylase domain protein n=1 Tax=Candidatus Falkowbacteria bacterium GW2011_GWF2_39_8 TaxID=1618642 RepID=A0A0G0Q967_9BACT|nr:MAG: ParB family nuclease domain and DNA-modification methylase domain protein [Parcubacteria group bacterium GW2011_GWE2_39_37]KKR33876.1 MAG: ParB family nuclease domain and DNA-modification methylase domain protein [Candidatus Falkowbacteria bacterium GW2011_GWF2_39_8]